MSEAFSAAAQITRASRSNLALAFIALPPERRRDISVFYAFCRLVDDIADEARTPPEERRARLLLWRNAVLQASAGEPELAPAVRALIAKYALPVEHFHEIIAGVEMDLVSTRYQTFEDLRIYCHRVASVVGLVSIEIFGYTDAACRTYAIELGLALQLTNILRDVGEDFAKERRIYLPREDLDQFGYTTEALAAGRRDAAFHALMQFEAQRAREFYRRAEQALPSIDRRSMTAAEIMRCVYQRLLTRMERDGFRVFEKRYRLGRLEKLACIARGLLAARRR